MNSSQFLIVADDVTGAADSAARCVEAGLTATINLTFGASVGGKPPSIASIQSALNQSALSQSDVLALSTDSRFLQPSVAATRVQAIVKALRQRTEMAQMTNAAIGQRAARQQWYKKIDSTLRGNIGAELAAMLPLVKPNGETAHAIICPAFPAQHRTFVDGYLCSLQLPPRTIHLPTMLTQQCSLSVTTIALDVVRAGMRAIRAALVAAQKQKDELIVIDAESDEDLAHLFLAATDLLPHALFCGSAGLVGVMAHHFAAQKPLHLREERLSTMPERSNKRAPIVIVVGSGSAMAHQQLDYLRQFDPPQAKHSIAIIEFDPTASEERCTMTRTEIATTIESDRDGMRQVRDVVLHLPKPEIDATLEGQTARQYAARLATIAKEIIEQIQPAIVLIVGGDTAVHLLQILEIPQLEVVRELLPGMPLAFGTTDAGEHYQIILKAGNHGDRQTLATLLQQINPT